MSDYTEHLISMAGGDGEPDLDAIQALLGSIAFPETPEERDAAENALLALVRDQAAKLGRVEALAEELDAESVASDNVAAEVMKAPRTNAIRQELRDHEQHATIATNHAARIRAAITATEAGE